MYHGMLTIRKEAGWTSSDVVAKLRRILNMQKIGHTGTLDPDAEGVLPICLGKATKLCELIADRDKEYRALMRLGITTDTQDLSGQVLREISEEEVRELVTEDRLRETVSRFTGEIMQVPPMYSAVKVGGKRLYEIARAGGIVERAARPVTIYELEIEEIALPAVCLRIRCSKGTYIRTLCHDIGEALGTGAAMEKLLRTRVGVFTLEESVTVGEAEQMMKNDPGRLERMIRPIDWFFADLPSCTAKKEAMRLLENGNRMKRSMTDLSGAENGELVRIYAADGSFRALYKYDAAGDTLKNYKLFFTSLQNADNQ